MTGRVVSSGSSGEPRTAKSSGRASSSSGAAGTSGAPKVSGVSKASGASGTPRSSSGAGVFGASGSGAPSGTFKAARKRSAMAARNAAATAGRSASASRVKPGKPAAQGKVSQTKRPFPRFPKFPGAVEEPHSTGNTPQSGRSVQTGRSMQSGQPARVGRAVGSAGAQTPAARPTRSQPGGFVDARHLGTDRTVGERLRDEGSGPFRRPKVIGFTARAKEERKARTLSILIRVGLALAVVAVVSGLTWLLFFSPVLKLQAGQIRVEGANEWVTEEQVSQIAAKQADKSLLVVSTGSIASELKAMPGVTTADVAKQWPHGLSITVAAQKPAAVLKSADGSMTAVDSQARVLNAVGASVAGIPVIDVDDVDSGLQNRAVQQALQILASLPESMRQRTTSVTAKTQDSVTTVLDGGNYTIVWGDASQLELKKAEVDKIINDPAVIGDKHQVNVSSPKKPIIK